MCQAPERRRVGAPRGWTFSRACDDPGLRALRNAGIRRGQAIHAAREQRIEQARAMQADGAEVQAIADALGVTVRKARSYLARPDVDCMIG
jgi:hypothetical protein